MIIIKREIIHLSNSRLLQQHLHVLILHCSLRRHPSLELLLTALSIVDDYYVHLTFSLFLIFSPVLRATKNIFFALIFFYFFIFCFLEWIAENNATASGFVFAFNYRRVCFKPFQTHTHTRIDRQTPTHNGRWKREEWRGKQCGRLLCYETTTVWCFFPISACLIGGCFIPIHEYIYPLGLCPMMTLMKGTWVPSIATQKGSWSLDETSQKIFCYRNWRHGDPFCPNWYKYLSLGL